MSHRFTGHDPAEGQDTGGVPWEGRTLTGTGFDHDTGEADAALSLLLARWATPGEVRPEELMAAVAAARLIVPIVAVPSEIDESSGIPVDAVSDMASVTLVAPDGQQALPAFTSTAALAAWNAEARPVPVTAQRAALAAVQEGCEVILLDLPAPPGAPALTLRHSMVWALAIGRPWVPAHRDEHVAAAVAAAVRERPEVRGHHLGEAEDGGLLITLDLVPGLDRTRLNELLTQVGGRIAADGEARARIDAVSFRLAAADR